jgi:peptide/nickel transport system substrate-binding protein
MLDPQTAGGTKPIGTGPFTFVEWKQGDHVTLARNKNYWQTGRPYLDGLQITLSQDLQASVGQLEAGAKDAVIGAPWREVARLKADPKYQTVLNLQSGGYYIANVNTVSGVTAGKQIRQALVFAMDRKKFVDTVLMGMAEQRFLPWNPVSPGWELDKNGSYGFDTDRAASLLRASGESDVQVDWLVSSAHPELLDFGQLYQADLARAGIKLNLKKVEPGPWLDQAGSRRFNGFAVSIGLLGQLEPVSAFLSSPSLNVAANTSGYKTETFTQLVNESVTTADIAQRRLIYSRLNDAMIDDAWAPCLASNPGHVVARAAIKGIAFTMYESFNWTNAWLES